MTIIDNHLHVFPDQGGTDVGPDPQAHRRQMQATVRDYWDKMLSSHTDPRYVPEPDEDVGFTVGKYGRYYWKKHGETCWLQRGPVTMEHMEQPPEQMVAWMDSVGVDMGVIQAEYLDIDTGRERYFRECVERWPNRFIGTAAINYDLTKDDEYLKSQIRNLTRAVEEYGFKALFVSDIAIRQHLNDPRCDLLWKEVVRLGVPVYINTGFCSKEEYLAQLMRIQDILKRFPELNVIDSHIGGHIRPVGHPDYIETPKEMYPLLKTGRFYLEIGYVLAYENFGVWGRDYQYPYPRHERIIRDVYENFGPRVLAWGSDMPWCMRTCTYRQNLDLVRFHTDYMTDEERDLILGGNLARLFGIETNAQGRRENDGN